MCFILCRRIRFLFSLLVYAKGNKTLGDASKAAMSSPETVFIVNPHAGGGSTATRWPRIAVKAKRILREFKTVLTRLPGDATTLTTAAVVEGTRRLVVVGGDGTLNEVINSLMAFDRELREKVCIGIVPNGTGCDFARTLSIPKDIDEALTLIQTMPIRPMDVGRIVFKDSAGRRSQRFFVNVVSFGLGGEVAHQVRKAPRSLGPAFAFFWATMIAVLRYGKKQIHLKIDENPSVTWRSWNVAIANGRYHGGGMLVAPDAHPDDGVFHITVIGDIPLHRIFSKLQYLYNGRIRQIEGVSGFIGTRVEAASNHPVLLDVDGEGPGLLPSIISIIPGALNLICPQDQRDPLLKREI